MIKDIFRFSSLNSFICLHLFIEIPISIDRVYIYSKLYEEKKTNEDIDEYLNETTVREL